ncbi:hypothetical protein ACFL9T_13545 [Thermodesulfobacteriota bacterium]
MMRDEGNAADGRFPTASNLPFCNRTASSMKNWANPRKFLFCSVILCLCLIPKISTASEDAPQPEPVNRDIIRAIDLLYDWKFEKAENIFLRVIAEKPKEPIGYFYLAMVTWSRLASGFWSPQMVKTYAERIEKTIFIAREKIESENADSFTYFYLGGALGFKGRFKLMQRKYFSAFFLALDAIDAFKTCLRLDPDNRDVLFGLGIYDYYTARLSGVAKFLSYLLIRKGNIQEGLRKLHAAADEAIYSSVEAKSLLIHIYLFLEGDYAKGLDLAGELARRFPNDPREKYFEGIAYIQLNRMTEYRAVLDHFLKKCLQEGLRVKARTWHRWALYLEASYYLFQNQTGQARSKLLEILSQRDPENDPFMIAWPLLKIGMSYDLDGQRDLALQYYEQVEAMENGAGAQFLVEKCRDKAPKQKDPFLGY